LNEIIIDQIPVLSELARTLDQLMIMNTNAQATANPFVVQQIPELKKSIMEGKDWLEIAKYQSDEFFSPEAEAREFDVLAKFADIYGGESVEALSEGFKCANCFQPATQRCSRCKTVWYCSRECQVEHFKKEHKNTCKLLAEKMAEKLDVSASKSTSGIILEPSKVKEAIKTSDIKMSSKEAASENTKLKVEVLSSTENESQKPVPHKADNPKKSPVPQPASKTSKAEEPKPKQHDEVKVSEIGVVKDPAEGPVNKLEELD
jgi:hypothetical protein